MAVPATQPQTQNFWKRSSGTTIPVIGSLRRQGSSRKAPLLRFGRHGAKPNPTKLRVIEPQGQIPLLLTFSSNSLQQQCWFVPHPHAMDDDDILARRGPTTLI